MEELNIGDKFKSSCDGNNKKWCTITDKITSQIEAERRSSSSFAYCDFYYEFIKGKGKKKFWMGHGCQIQEDIIELVRNTIINNYAIY